MAIIALMFGIVGAYIVAIIGFIIVVVMIVKTIINKDEERPVLKIIIIIVVYIVFVLVVQWLFTSDFSSPSKVNTEPLYMLADITYISQDDMTKILNEIKNRDGFSNIEDFYGARTAYSFGWHGDLNPREPGGVMVDVYYFDSTEDATADFSYDRYYGFSENTLVRVSENIAAKLFNSRVDRNADTFYATDFKKLTYTDIIVGNVIVHIYE